MLTPGRLIPRIGLAGLSVALLSTAPALADRYYAVWGDKDVLRENSNGGGSGGSDQEATTAVTVNSAGDVIAVTGQIGTSSGGVAGQVMKYSPAGNRLWATPLGGSSYGKDVITDASGNVYVAGYQVSSVTGNGPAVWKFNSAGALVWTWTGSQSSQAFETITFKEGYVFVGGGSIAMINSDGTISPFEDPTPTSGTAHGIYCTTVNSASGTVFVSYTNYLGNGTGSIASMSPAGGSPRLTRTGVGGGRLRLGPDGLLYAAAYADPTSSGSNFGYDIASLNAATLGVVQRGYLGITDPSNQNGCCAYGTPTDLAFLPDGTMVVSWAGGMTSGGFNNGHSGIVGCERTIGSNGTDAYWTTKWSQPNFLPFLTEATFDVRGIAVGGTKVFAGTGRIVNGGTSGSNNVYPGLIGLDNVLASNPPKKNSLQIRRNVIHVDWGGSALLLLRGSPGAHLNISVFGLGGNLVTSLKPCSNCTGSQEFELDATGALNVDFDGTYDGNIALKPGIYFIVVSGAFSDRQPIVIKGTKSKT